MYFPDILLLFTAIKNALNLFRDCGYLVTHSTFLSADGFWAVSVHRLPFPAGLPGPSAGRQERSRQQKAAAVWQGSQNSVTGISQKKNKAATFVLVYYFLIMIILQQE